LGVGDSPHVELKTKNKLKRIIMKNYAITSGKFTTKGNFTGYNALGERVHVHAAQMASLGWKKDEDLAGKFPFYAVAAIKQIGQLDEEGNPKTGEGGVAILVDRLTATSVFATKQALIDARVDDATLNVEIGSAVAGKAKAAGLSEKAVADLLAASV
jgi:hypothetical protein